MTRGIEMALRRILADPKFLFRFERDPASMPAGRRYRISDLELASRLSFFLWSSIPDDELLQTGRARGKLNDPAVLEQQVRRMLADPRSQALVEQLRRSVAVSCASCRTANPDRQIGFRRQSAAGLPARDRDARSRASSAKIAACSIC